jgi:hypothetical protein
MASPGVKGDHGRESVQSKSVQCREGFSKDETASRQEVLETVANGKGKRRRGTAESKVVGPMR